MLPCTKGTCGVVGVARKPTLELSYQEFYIHMLPEDLEQIIRRSSSSCMEHPPTVGKLRYQYLQQWNSPSLVFSDGKERVALNRAITRGTRNSVQASLFSFN